MIWTIDPAHTEINFTVRHMMISNVRGRFEKFTGEVNFNEEEPEKSSVKVQIEAASIDTKEEKRNAHLRSADFFNADQFPYLTFESKRIEMIDKQRARIYGDLTIKDATKEVVLDTYYAGQSKSPGGTISAGFTAQTSINRTDWGLTWNVALETGGLLVGEEVKIDIELEIVKQEVAESTAA